MERTRMNRMYNRKAALAALALALLAQGAGPVKAQDLVSLDEAIAAGAAAIEAAVPRGVEIAIIHMEAPPGVARFITNRLNARFLANRNLKVLVREKALNVVNTEHIFQMSGLVSTESAVGIRHYLGVKVVIVGLFEGIGAFNQFWLRAIDVETSRLLALYPALIRVDPLLAELMAHPDSNQTPPLQPAPAPSPAPAGSAAGFFNQGAAHYDNKDYDRAIASFTEALRIDPNHRDAKERLTDTHNIRGNVHYHKGDYDRAITDYTAALGINPNFAYGYNNRGVAYYHKEDYDRAIADYTAALRIDPNYALAYNNRGNAYRDKGDHDRAIADYNAALRIDPNHADATEGLATARQARDRALSPRPAPAGNAATFFNQGKTHHNNKDYD